MRYESAYDMRPVLCFHCSAPCQKPCANAECDEPPYCEGCMYECEGCDRSPDGTTPHFCVNCVVEVDGLKCCVPCNVKYYAGEMEAA